MMKELEEKNTGAIEISVIMAIYHPNWEKCLFTLDSILGQKGVCFELIITDDGSENNLFDKFESYLTEKGFNNYRLISHEQNQGTVKNYCDGLKAANGKYVKLISPGDALYNETTLQDWLSFLTKSGKTWSFGEAVFYQIEDAKRKIVSAPAFPRMIGCYKKGKPDTCRWNYVVLEDVALGAAILCDRNEFLSRLAKLTGIVKFAEDTAITAMVYDGLLPAYYSHNAMFYEYGTGVSTGEQAWKKRIQEDLKNAELVLASKENGDKEQMKMSKALARVNSGSSMKKKIMKIFQRGGLRKTLKFRLCPRKSSSDYSDCGKWW